MVLLLSLAMAFGGVTALSLSLQRHYRDAFGRPLSQAVAASLRVAGYALLAAALSPCVETFGASVGVVIWLGFLSAASLLRVFLMAWKPKLTAWIGAAAPFIGISLLLLPDTKG